MLPFTLSQRCALIKIIIWSQYSYAVLLQMSKAHMCRTQSQFDELADNYIQARMPVLAGKL